MPIFRRDPEEPHRSAEPAESPRHRPRTAAPDASNRQETLIAPGSKVVGEILGPTPVRVAGSLGGRIRVDETVRVEPNGEVEGDIEARNVFIGGKVTGNVRGSERVVLGATGHLEGDVRAPRVIIEEGAFLKGEVEMGGDAPSPAARRQQQPAAAKTGEPATPPKPEDAQSSPETPKAGGESS